MVATDPFEQLVMEYAFHGVDPDAAPTDLYIGLHTDDPNADGTATSEPGTENEVTASDYSRAVVGATTANWSIDTSNQQATVVENAEGIPFDIAGSAWGTITHWSVWTGPQGDSSAEPLITSTVESTTDITENDQVRWPPGTLTAEMD